jgi:hypothetical protein
MVDPEVEAAEVIFRGAVDWLGKHYGEHVFYVERDIIFTLQTHMVEQVRSDQLPLRVYNDFPMIAGLRRSLSADLALVATPGDRVLLAAEFKYEPCHRRLDLLKNKLPVTVWSEIVHDTERAQQFIEPGRAKIAYAICIDEGNYLAKRDLSAYGDHLEWAGQPHHDHNIAVHLLRVPSPGV